MKRKAIAIDASFISKAGKKTPYIGSDSSVKRGLEILGIGIVDMDRHDCMMLRAEQTPDSDTLKSKGDGYNLAGWYLDVLSKFKDKLLAET